MSDEEFRAQLISAINYMTGGQLSGPSGLELLAMALSGRDGNVASSIDRVAEAIDGLSEAVRERK
jgi:hypothetical protein